MLDLLRHGIIVWGQIVQANYFLFEPGDRDSPADILFSFDRSGKVNPLFLKNLSRAIAALKGTEPDDFQLIELAATITSEYSRQFGFGVPLALSQ